MRFEERGMGWHAHDGGGGLACRRRSGSSGKAGMVMMVRGGRGGGGGGWEKRVRHDRGEWGLVSRWQSGSLKAELRDKRAQAYAARGRDMSCLRRSSCEL